MIDCTLVFLLVARQAHFSVFRFFLSFLFSFPVAAAAAPSSLRSNFPAATT